MNEQETLYAIALTLTPRIGLLHQHRLMEQMGSATAIWQHRHHIQDLLPDATPTLVEVLKQMEAQLPRAQQEMEWAAKCHVKLLTMGDAHYPVRLNSCPDAPIVLYFQGNANLNAPQIVSVVGTRRISEYGKDLCQHFVEQLAQICPHTLLVSGLAYGVDIHAHRAALQQGLPTIGVLAHGLDQVYPRMHTDTAQRMMAHGGLLTEFVTHTNADKRNFVQRNRIVAGLCDAVVVVESARKGGALITATMANSYNHDVFAFPGRVRDEYSQGCNELIRTHKAQLITCADDLASAMSWVSEATRRKHLQAGIQQQLFPTLTPHEQRVVDALRQVDKKSINVISAESGIAIAQLSGILFELEMKGVAKMLPGGLYRLL